MTVQMVKIGSVLRPLDGDRESLKRFKESVKEGQVIDVVFSTVGETRRAAQSRLFHKIRDRYAEVLGLEKEYAKTELCVQRGIALAWEDALLDPPTWPGHLIEIWGQRYIRKSTSAYTLREMSDLIEGSKLSCFEADVDIDDLLTEFDVRVSA